MDWLAQPKDAYNLILRQGFVSPFIWSYNLGEMGLGPVRVEIPAVTRKNAQDLLP